MKPNTPPRGVRPTLAPWARRIAARATWDKLVLPAAQAKTLRSIMADARRPSAVPPRVLLTGAHTTAKARVAQVLARELQRPLYRVDLAAVMSKYIGETEKNLKRLFAAAAAVDAILLFDEGDALFGKRTEPRDAHDRYAKLQTAALLQRMHAHRGMLIVAAARKGNLDDAFTRRFRRVLNLA